MALHYNLARVYAHANNNQSFVNQKIMLFLGQIREHLKEMKKAIEDKKYQEVYDISLLIQSHLEWMGLNLAVDDVVFIRHWSESEGKRKEVKEVFKSLEFQTEKAVKEIKKDFAHLI
jgi:hypothetical protein